MSRQFKPHKTTGRREFIQRWMDECGVTFDVAGHVYDSMVSAFEDGVVNGGRITIGRLGCLMPYWSDPRDVVLGCRKRKGGGIEKTRRVYHLDGRIRYRFNIYKVWFDTHELHWYE